MKKILSLLLILPSFVLGDYFTVEARVGGFFPASQLLRKIYGDSGIEYEAEGSLRLYDCFNLWLNVSSFEKNGRTPLLNQKTTLHLLPVSLGIKSNFPINQEFIFYLGGGITHTSIHTHNKSPFVKRHIHKYAWGGVLKSGFIYSITTHFFADLFLDYYYTKVRARNGRHNLGGVRTGIGFGLNY